MKPKFQVNYITLRYTSGSASREEGFFSGQSLMAQFLNLCFLNQDFFRLFFISTFFAVFLKKCVQAICAFSLISCILVLNHLEKAAGTWLVYLLAFGLNV